ncbi:MAG: ribonuclease H-like domain-containing protein [Flavobacteriia bacterium]|nr:ribonuclease H-like domain-containing protein [Flavobacteriia bacterium]OJX34797.1 MAG: DNA polymerase III subunit epsilon [Flavobacteriia bacterium 40-80]
MEIQLKRPIVTFDIESTGLNVSKDRIIEIAILKVHPDGKEETFESLVNPKTEISREIEELTGISNEDVKGQPEFAEIATNVLQFIDGCDLVGYNFHKLDIPLLAEEFLRVGIDFNIEERKLIDVQNIFHKMEQRTLAAAYLFYCKKELENAHSAMADTKATWNVLNAQLNHYSDLQKDVDFLADFSKNSNNKYADFSGRLVRNEKNEIVYNFGKHKGKTVAEVNKTEPGYYGWFIGESTDFPNYTKNVLRKEMERLKAIPVKSEAPKRTPKPKEEDTMSIEEKLNALKNKFSK